MDAGEALDVAARLLNLPEPRERKGRKTYPAGMLAGIGRRQDARQPPVEVAVYDELSRLNNELLDRPAGTGPQERPTGAAQRAAGRGGPAQGRIPGDAGPRTPRTRWPRCGTPPTFSNSPAWISPSLSAPGR